MIKYSTIFFVFLFCSFQGFAQKKNGSAPVAPSKSSVKSSGQLESGKPMVAEADQKPAVKQDRLRILVLKGTETPEELAKLEKEVMAAFAGVRIIPVGSSDLFRYISFPSTTAAEIFRLGNPDLLVLKPEELAALAAALKCQTEMASPELLEKLSSY